MRPAFTLVELLVAIVVFSVGVLALAATAAAVAGHVADGGQLTGGAHAARSVLDSLSARPCAELTSGARLSATGSRATWRVVRDSNAARVEVTVVTPLRRRSVELVYEALVPCVAE